MSGFLLTLCRKYGKRQVFLGCLALLMLLAALLLVALFGQNQRYSLHDLSLTFAERGGDAVQGYVILRDAEGFLVLEYLGNETDTFHFTATIRWGTKEIACESTLGQQAWRFSDGSEVILSQEQVFIGLDGDLTAYQDEERAFLFELLRLYRDGGSAGDYILAWVIASLFLLLGCGLYFYPIVFWKFHTRMLINDGEPSRWALSGNKLAGGVIVLAVFGMLLYIFAVLY